MNIGWTPLEGALLVTGSRQSAINTLWRMFPEDQRSPVARNLTIAVVDFIRDYHQRTGHLAPGLDDKQEVLEALALVTGTSPEVTS